MAKGQDTRFSFARRVGRAEWHTKADAPNGFGQGGPSVLDGKMPSKGWFDSPSGQGVSHANYGSMSGPYKGYVNDMMSKRQAALKSGDTESSKHYGDSVSNTANGVSAGRKARIGQPPPR